MAKLETLSIINSISLAHRGTFFSFIAFPLERSNLKLSRRWRWDLEGNGMLREVLDKNKRTHEMFDDF